MPNLYPSESADFEPSRLEIERDADPTAAQVGAAHGPGIPWPEDTDPDDTEEPALECSYCAAYAIKRDGTPSGLHRTAGDRDAIVRHAEGHPLGDPEEYPIDFDEDMDPSIPVDYLP